VDSKCRCSAGSASAGESTHVLLEPISRWNWFCFLHLQQGIFEVSHRWLPAAVILKEVWSFPSWKTACGHPNFQRYDVHEIEEIPTGFANPKGKIFFRYPQFSFFTTTVCVFSIALYTDGQGRRGRG